MRVRLGRHLLACMQEAFFAVPRLWLILACVLASWLTIGLVVFAIYNLAA